MSKRSERLLMLLQSLRRRRMPVTGQALAEELGVSLRSTYRDIETLRSLGAVIDGEAGVGFQLRADYWMPPLMFSHEEIEALVLGMRTLIHGNDPDMARVAADVRSKIATVLPDERREEMDAVGLFAVPPPKQDEEIGKRLTMVRAAIREESELAIGYTDKNGAVTERVIWPFAIGYLGNRQIMVAWCTLRTDYRRFWIDRIISAVLREKRYSKPRRTLMHEWRQREGLPDIG